MYQSVYRFVNKQGEGGQGAGVFFRILVVGVFRIYEREIPVGEIML